MEEVLDSALNSVKTPDMSRLRIGDIVLFVLHEGRSIGQVRPAIVTRIWLGADGKPQPNGICQLTIFPDQSNDQMGAVSYFSSAIYSPTKELGTWHWREELDEATVI